MEKMTIREIISDTKGVIKEMIFDDGKEFLSDAIKDFVIEFSKDMYGIYVYDHLSKLNIFGKISSILTMGILALSFYLMMLSFLIMLFLYLILMVLCVIVFGVLFFPFIVIFRYINQRSLRPLFRFLFIKKESK